MKKEHVEEFVKMMNSHAHDYGAEVSLVSSDDRGFVVRVVDEDDLRDGLSDSNECQFQFGNGSFAGLLRLIRLYGEEVSEGEGWFVSRVPAAAFALCWAGG